ncbi:Uncharacterized protein FKW44_015604 [Caligus rogercresseyi]|uniref:Reverse transcriptase domain-containing protein n=1 Tax=Caligus rogercresseyi TaxID=217165 RepID=A0A7T8JZV2_CALRO|nr:Uncharacterized protein FKW44_015604 [Caligus rogercresseyi]
MAQDNGSKVAIAAFDYSAAFDTISPSALLDKLQWMEIGAHTLIGSYMKGRTQRVCWNGALSKPVEVKFGVPQGSCLGPLLFILLTADLPEKVCKTASNLAGLGVFLYADDTSVTVEATTWDDVKAATRALEEDMVEYSRDNALHLNVEKTQILHLKNPQTIGTLGLLGVEIDRNGAFGTHHANVLNELRKRTGAIRRLASVLPRGKLLNEIARALVIGKLNVCAWVTRRSQGYQDQSRREPGAGDNAAVQVILNDLARTLNGVRRSDRIRASDLLDRSGLPTVNEVVTSQSAMAVWKVSNDPTFPLAELLVGHDERTRGAALNLKKASTSRSVAAKNMADAWSSSPDLRDAQTLVEARQHAKILGRWAREADS